MVFEDGFLLHGSLLAVCASLGARLPYRRGDEPLTVLYHINLLISRRAEDVLSALKALATAGDGSEAGPPADQVCARFPSDYALGTYANLPISAMRQRMCSSTCLSCNILFGHPIVQAFIPDS